jgi:hypothetical protein
VIYNISPEETPFLSGCGKASCDNTRYEWQIDSLDDAVDDNIVAEGFDAAAMAATETVRVGNWTQISTKTVQTSGTAEAVDFAGRKSTHAYQMAKRAKECKLDMEKMLLLNRGGATGSSGVARQTRSVGSWIGSIIENGTAAASETASATAGTDKAVEEIDIRNVMSDCYTAGAKPDILMVDGPIKQAISQMAQTVSPLQTTANAASAAHVVAAVDIYVSDFGNLKITPNRLMPAKTGYFFDMSFWDVSYLRPWMTHDLARTGDSKSAQLLVEYGLTSKNEEASAQIMGWDPAL